ncbi:MAG: VWA domain-containing protein [Methylophaga sp.]|nr:VWA domain-containing protein [Methylophaga sp.]
MAERSVNYLQRIRLTAMAMCAAVVLIMAALWFPHVDRDIKVVDTLFVLDITDSMLVKDARMGRETLTRLDWSQEFVRQAMLEMPCGSKVSLAAFTDSRSLILINPIEVCANYHDLIQVLHKIEPPMAWAKASEISKALFTAINQAKDMDPEPSIVFITDGHEAPPLHETLYPKFGGTPGEVSGVLIGVGGTDLQPIPKSNEDGEIIGYWDVNEVLHVDVYAAFRGDLAEAMANVQRTEHLSSQKHDHMERLGIMVGFDYLDMPTANQLMRTLRAHASARTQRVDYDPYPVFAGLALLLLLLLYLPYGLLLGLRKRKT